MGADRDFIGRMAPELELLLPGLDERSRRLVLGAVARAAGDGGVTAVAQAAGASWRTVADGAGELASGDDAGPGRVRRAGGGRKKPEERDPRLIPALRELLEASTRGDRQSLITWTALSVRGVAAELTAAGHRCARSAALRMLHAGGFSTQGNSRTAEGKQHPGRDAQFRCINDLAKRYLAAGDPVISIGTKKKELAGLYAQRGRKWRPKGDPRRVRDHDFPDPQGGKAIPYGVYDIGADAGSSAPAPVTAPRRSPRNRSAAGGTPSARTATRTRRGCWSPATPAAPAGTGPGRGRRSWPGSRPGPGWRSPCAISRPAPARHLQADPRSGTGCSATSPAPGGAAR